MKILFAFLCLNFLLLSFSQKKLEYALCGNLNTSFSDGKREGIRDFLGYDHYQLNPGFGLGLSLNYKLSERLDLMSGFHLSFESFKFGYYTYRNGSRYTRVNLPIYLKYHLRSKSENNFFLQAGVVFSLNSSQGCSYYESVNSSAFVPDFSRTNYEYKKIYPLLFTGVGWRCFTPGGRKLEYLLGYQHGFFSFEDYIVENYDTGDVTTFQLNSSLLRLQLNWYFKSK